MRCDDIRDRLDTLWEGQPSPEVREHLAGCADCSAYHRDLRLLNAGLKLWRQEDVPAPSLGFADRLVRQLGEISKTPSVADFFEMVGRRFVYATLALTLLVLLALSVPSSGPVRALNVADIQVPAQEASLAYSDPMGEVGLQESPDLAPAPTPTPAVTNEAK
jgi:hypothetical protein